MTSIAASVPRAFESRFGVCLAILTLLTLVRLAGLWFSAVDLYFDESQYWAWSREPAFGYFSKPPLLAWVIATAESICGSTEACVRSPAPVLHLATCILVFLVGKTLYDRQTAFWAALLLAFGTGLAFSARIISTDVPLIFFWTLAILAFLNLRQGGAWAWGVVLGAALGLGLLAKYTMLYFVFCVAVAAVVDRDTRALLRRPPIWIALAIGAALIAPNLFWNAQHGFVTFRHVGDNIEGGGMVFSVAKGLEFLLAQFAVFGPIVFATLLAVIVSIRSPSIDGRDRLMLCFSLPVLATVAATAFVTRAHGNWAALAAVSATILAAAVLVRRRHWGLIATSIGIGLVAQVVLLVGDANAYRIKVPFLAKPDIYHRTLGWRELGAEAGRLADGIGAAAIAAEQRHDIASLMYYQRDRGRPVLSWPARRAPDHHFDLSHRLTSAVEPVLFVTECPATQRLVQHYRSVEPLGSFNVATGPTSARRYFAFKLAQPQRAIGPISACR
jgi:4-amino-4-deoxy-L-arabinose transferase-like glycosyltransferase